MNTTPEFRKSSYSTPQSQNCVEVADCGGEHLVRDTQNRRLGHLAFVSPAWAAFLAAAQADTHR
ncbi:DUF397 domain-containing protein [Nocardiopsis sp. FIRDI 009]|uniref:DUF397 domain-containing protein n=1 Tax=Nocardiopsis sp. FIRDI 009 TaxID=714197 RepID=UPI000E286F03|nr:DUF397 domain-containing protein [Nocardiopsis sp. FIRDI 009]